MAILLLQLQLLNRPDAAFELQAPMIPPKILNAKPITMDPALPSSGMDSNAPMTATEALDWSVLS